MFYKYELVCKAAGLSEEETAKIRNYIDVQRRKMKRENQIKERLGISFHSLEGLSESLDEGIYELQDMDADTERDAIRNIELENLRKAMSELPEEDREFLFAAFEDYKDAEKRIGEKLGLTRGQVQYRKRKLIQSLREKMGVTI